MIKYNDKLMRIIVKKKTFVQIYFSEKLRPSGVVHIIHFMDESIQRVISKNSLYVSKIQSQTLGHKKISVYLYLTYT